MSEEKGYRLGQVARKINVGLNTLADHLASKGHKVENNPNARITEEHYNILLKEFQSSFQDKKEASELVIGGKRADFQSARNVVETAPVEKKAPEPVQKVENASSEKVVLQGLNVLGKIDLNAKKPAEQVKKTIPEPVEAVVEKPVEKIVEKPVEKPIEKIEEPIVKVVIPEPVVQQEVKPVVVPEPEVKETKIEAPVEKPVLTTVVEAPVVEDPTVTANPDVELYKGKADTLKGLSVLGKIELPVEKDKSQKPSHSREDDKKKRKRISGHKAVVDFANRPQNNAGGNNSNNTSTPGQRPAGTGTPGQRPAGNNTGTNNNNRDANKKGKETITTKEIQGNLKSTLAKLGSGKSQFANRTKYRKDKRQAFADGAEERALQAQEEAKILKVTEFVSANEMASMMDISVNEVISACMGLGMFVSINQRLDAEMITLIAHEFGFDTQFTTAEDELTVEEAADEEGSQTERAPIVTIMGHVDHGKTSLLDYIRRTKVTASEAGGITQHIGAYDVTTSTGRKITFLDTPGHEAFTAMRARGAKVTDIVIIVVAADDNVMPQTKEAINHAQLAGVPIIIALNKIDKPAANPDKIKEELSQLNILVEDWGGKYQCEHISAKTGIGIESLLEKVLLEADILELKANSDKKAIGTIIEASLDKGRGFVTTVLVQSGTLNIGDMMLAGQHYGKVKAMFDHTGKKLITAGPSTPALVLGLDGAPQAGDKFNIMESDKEARDIATKRGMILREQAIRTRKHITLDEIGRRLAIGNFKQLNIIVKADFDGSVEALSDSLLKLSTPEIQVSIIHKGVGQISESDVLLASASDAIILGFQVRPSGNAKKVAEQEQIEIRFYSIIYDAINELKDAMEGMLAPTIEEVVTGVAEVREVFKISNKGTVAGCMVLDGNIKRNQAVRLVRDGIVLYTGKIDALKRFKDDVGDVKFGFECGISLKDFHDIEEKDTIECFEQKETKRKL
ncbi:MAG: translation initiation factor IF-2 [Opitutaceae bacterium]|nr:translation initiation factor IF-2 [Cytophagales bacterium]